MRKVFHGLSLSYYKITDEIFYLPSNMTELMIEARPSYPSNKMTFTIANIKNHKSIRSLFLYLKMNGQFDVDVVLEDAKRNFVNSYI